MVESEAAIIVTIPRFCLFCLPIPEACNIPPEALTSLWYLLLYVHSGHIQVRDSHTHPHSNMASEQSVALTLTLTLTDCHSHTLSHTLTHSHTLSQTPSHSHTLPHTPTYSHILPHIPTHTLTHSNTLTCVFVADVSCWRTNTTHTYSYLLILTHTLRAPM